MSTIATTKLSSKGQVVIPEDVRVRLHLTEGTQFVVIGEGDAVVLKTISPPSMGEFKGLLKQAQAEAKAVGMKKSDISEAIQNSRAKRKRSL